MGRKMSPNYIMGPQVIFVTRKYVKYRDKYNNDGHCYAFDYNR